MLRSTSFYEFYRTFKLRFLYLGDYILTFNVQALYPKLFPSEARVFVKLFVKFC